MKRSILAASLAACALGLVVAPVAHAGSQPQSLHVAQAKAAALHKGSGVVKSVNAQAGAINLDHGPIASLGWGAMAMDFPVKDPALLKGIKPGQKVEFDLISEGPGRFVITRIAPVK